MTESTVFIPPERRPGRGAFVPPLLLIPLVLYNLVVFLVMGGDAAGWGGELFTLPMVSGATWSLTWADLLLVVALVCLFLEVLKATQVGRTSIVEHMLSTLVLVIFLVEFLLIGSASSSVFFLLLMMSIFDVVAGFTISITSASRDVTMG